jgi:choline/glycine/proline betaine transport protein
MAFIKGWVINKPVFWTVSAVIIIALTICRLFNTAVEKGLGQVQLYITSKLGWILIISVDLLVVFAIFLVQSRFRHIRLGGPDAKPAFSKGAWFSMLFSAGMGIGILFYGVAEPLLHFRHPPLPKESEAAVARQAMSFTFLHWGVHAWAIYAMVALALAYASFNRHLPLTFRWLFYPLWKERLHGWLGHGIDILAALATLFGLATTLGFGARQMSAGINQVTHLPDSSAMQSIIIVVVSAVAIISVGSGLDKGVKQLSKLNVMIALGLMLIILVLGPTAFIIKSYVQNIGGYLNDLISLSTWSDSFGDTGWQNNWTIFYWSWWIAWSPFVGIFIATISKGRTIGEFITGVLLVPALLAFLWFTVFGSTALRQLLQGNPAVANAAEGNVAVSLFVFLEQFPFSTIISVVSILLIAFFFVTSSDSGSLVVDSITSGGAPNTPATQRIYWAIMQGAIAMVLLWGGGLQALQTATIITGLPFGILLILMGYSLWKGLNEVIMEK